MAVLVGTVDVLCGPLSSRLIADLMYSSPCNLQCFMTKRAFLGSPDVCIYADTIISAFYNAQEVQFGSMNFVRVVFADMFSPIVSMSSQDGAANFFNCSFVRISEPLTGTVEEKSFVSDPSATKKVYGDSQAAQNIAIPIKTRNDIPQGLFITEEDEKFKQLQQVLCSH
jgi:hypothetical protein